MEARSSARDEKQRLRRSMRSARRALAPEAQAQAARALAAFARSEPLASARTVAAYVATDGEIDVAPLLDRLRASGSRLLLPRLRADGALDLVAFESGATLRPAGPSAIPEPDGEPVTLSEAATPAVLLAPAVALDGRGARLGRGGGGYDRLIPDLRRSGWCLLGVCHALQIVDRLPIEEHDQPVDGTLSEAGLAWVDPSRGGARS